LENGIVKKEINLQNYTILKKYKKIIVTGPPRSGTTISGLILAHELNYKFIDESWYDANNPKKFMFLFGLPRKMVIQTTAFLKDLHKVDFECIVLIKRPIKDILESFENSLNFTMEFSTSNGIMSCFGKKEQQIILNHYGHKSGCIPEIIYNHFEKHNKNYYYLNYNSLTGHELFIKKEVRRQKFNHLKQVKIDPYYLQNQKGIMVL
jgi:hypothetical protein